MSEKVSVPEYLAKHHLQQMIEDAVNECYEKQSEDPAGFFAKYFQSQSSEEKEKKIQKVVGREILDSRGNPTVETDVYVNGKLISRESAPSGASTGSNEAMELRDKEDRYLGKGVTKAVENVSTQLNDALKDKPLNSLVELDEAMKAADGTELKTNIGGNAITATSFALAAAGANLSEEELFIYLNKQFRKINENSEAPAKYRLPIPCANILNGGKHAGGKLKIQEFMICPKEGIEFKEGIRMIAEVYHHLGKNVVEKKGKSAKNVGDEGGFAPDFDEAEEAISVIEESIQSAGYIVGQDMFICLDAAASEFYDKEQQKYEISEGTFVTPDEMIDFYANLVDNHPSIISIEDPLDEKDYENWTKLTERIGEKCQIVGDDLYTTNTNLIKQGLENKWANALLLKVNQIGTISEAMEAAKMIMDQNQNVMVSHRSGETSTTIIADLAVAIRAKYIKTGASARGERVAKYNRLLAIEEYLKEHDMLEL